MNRIACLLLFVALSLTAQASPCTGVDEMDSPGTPVGATSAIAAQLGVSSVDILRSLKYGGWQILYVRSPAADDAFLFYKGEPTQRRYIAMWAGAYTREERAAAAHWARTNAPGIPRTLAECFASVVSDGAH
jgi:hypothetical protein